VFNQFTYPNWSLVCCIFTFWLVIVAESLANEEFSKLELLAMVLESHAKCSICFIQISKEHRMWSYPTEVSLIKDNSVAGFLRPTKLLYDSILPELNECE
jgi:hypothetical protein